MNNLQQPKSSPKQLLEVVKIKTEPLKLQDMINMEDLLSLEESLSDPPKVKPSSIISLRREDKAEHLGPSLLQNKITLSIVDIDYNGDVDGQILNTPSKEAIGEKVQEKKVIIEKESLNEQNHHLMRATRSLSKVVSTSNGNQPQMRASRSRSTTKEKPNLIKTSILEKGEKVGKRSSSIRKRSKKRGASIQKGSKKQDTVETTSKNNNKNFEIATLVWARLSKRDPFWPAFVHGVKEFDPFFRVTSKGNKEYREYHVVFFDRPITWIWSNESNIELFTGNTDIVDDVNLCEGQKIKPTLQDRFNEGLVDAIKASKLTPQAILENYYFDPAKNLDDLRHQKFEVESILDKRIVSDGTVEYYIKWENYTSAYNTWEPISNLDCEELIEDFEDNLKDDKNSKKRGTSSKGVQLLVSSDSDSEEDRKFKKQEPYESDASTTDISVTLLENSPPKKKVRGSRPKRKRGVDIKTEKDLSPKKRTRGERKEEQKNGEKANTVDQIEIKDEKMDIHDNCKNECEDIMVLPNRRSSARINSNAQFSQIIIRNYSNPDDWYIKLSADSR